MSELHLARVGDGPILRPRPEVPWEKDAVLNAAVIYDTTLDRGPFHMLYRAVAHNPGDPNRSSIGYAWSEDGVHFERRDEPVLRPNVVPAESQGVEDPRMVKLGDTFYMTYTAYDLVWAQIALATSKDLIHWERQGIIIGHELFGFNKDAAIFPEKIGGRYCMMHRPDPDIYLAFSDDLQTWTDHVCILQPEYEWEVTKIGGGAQPIKTDKGWLMIYHGVDADRWYRLGVAMLDLKDPTRVIARQAAPILEPQMDWELVGDVNNVVFTCGAVLLERELWVYYGSADTVIGLAKANIADYLSSLL
ncbi:MAG: glycosidase [Anaerolineae bacterium]|nr:glycosidase [Anaerolineae bacterium]